MLTPVNRLPSRGRPWGPADLTGGPLDRVLVLVRQHVPGLIVERLQAVRPGDDDNLFFLGDEFGLDRVQVSCSPRGRPPFLIENGGTVQTADVAEAAAVINSWLDEAP